MTTKRLPREIERAIKRFEAAAVDLSWLGSEPPSEWPAIRREYKAARSNLFDLLKRRINS